RQPLELVRSTMNGPAAKEIVEKSFPAEPFDGMLGKPLLVAGRTTTGGKLTTADLKGKVILIDFWATWCGPCNAEIPRIRELYKTYHSQGLEIVGVDGD